jgi:stearoyl-CoA desaturase (delta-9 desaturase)
MTTTTLRRTPPAAPSVEVEARNDLEQLLLYVFIVAPFLALAGGIWLAILGHGITWTSAALSVAFYALTTHGITIGYHRYFTHGSFKAKRPLRIALAAAGSMAVEGGIIRWVADHRKHHKYADTENDPHSPWRFGSTPRAMMKGLWWAHTGWLLDRERSPKVQYAPDLVADRDIARIHRLFPAFVLLTVAAPPLLALAITQSWREAGLAFLWASLVRVLFVHHVTWSINSICHMFGDQPFRSRDRSTNFWPLAILSGGESWHNLHHADPTCARHGVDKGQIDSTARIIELFEWLGWASDVRWPKQARLDARRVSSS